MDRQATALQNKKILLGVCGGIAAYKAPIIVRRLRDYGAEVKVVLTHGGAQFITPLSLQAVSGNDVRMDLLDSEAENGMDHIALARWADMLVIAPATAHTIAKLVHGMADDLLSTLCLATTAPIVLAPAMNQQMWQHPATTSNIAKAKQLCMAICGPASGEQACGEVGYGRMSEPEEIVSFVNDYAAKISDSSVKQKSSPQIATNKLPKKLLITAGPTVEAIDPVRAITNHSSGTMGYMLAQSAAKYGIDVTLISGPTALDCPAGVNRINVHSAQDMHDAVHKLVNTSDMFISVAAVADYRPADYASSKIKKSDNSSEETMILTLVKNPDILASVATLSNNRPFCVGFAAETENMLEYAKGKLVAKKLDMIIANRVGDNTGFGDVSHQVSILSKLHDSITTLGPNHKAALANEIMENILAAYSNNLG